ncbi:hypothetical protein BUALT_Bualt08G0002000 [Buddleja alternifolia]|uniref:Uncharacterized protein n=1 Tax=Buddleja alternifolia TaxID=168488 RepID=A0AAV6X1X6_9LAMI|nr:hypothetical protein BUALT_Bualt08G0002000 [Buddleja alternifolia]
MVRMRIRKWEEHLARRRTAYRRRGDEMLNAANTNAFDSNDVRTNSNYQEPRRSLSLTQSNVDVAPCPDPERSTPRCTQRMRFDNQLAAASNYAFSSDRDALYHLCRNHVENFMELWNTSDEFRRETAVEDQGAEFDTQKEKLFAVSGKVSKPMIEGGNGKVECTKKNSPLVSGSIPEQGSSLEDGDMVQVFISNSLEEHNEKIELDAVGTRECFCKDVVGNGASALHESKNELEDQGAELNTSKNESSLEYADGIQVFVANLEEHNGRVANNPPANFDVKVDSGVPNSSTTSCGEMASDETILFLSNNYNVGNAGASSILSDTEAFEYIGDQFDGAKGSSYEILFLPENEDTGNSHSSNISMASPKSYCAVLIDRLEAEQIRLAKLHVDEKTELRDAIQIQIQEKRANSQIYCVDYKYAKAKYRSARTLVRSKRIEIDYLQSVINKAKYALTVEDIDRRRIYNMEHMIQHNTLLLNEEKLLIREIKQLKQLRKQLSSNLGSQDEIKQAFEKREEAEEHLRVQELDILKDSVLKAEAAVAEAVKKHDHENKKLKELQAQFKAAADFRQEESLRKELLKKLGPRSHNSPETSAALENRARSGESKGGLGGWDLEQALLQVQDIVAAASNYAFSSDRDALYLLCKNHVENFMELWNTSDEFRREYVMFNTRSTLGRMGTLDGRSLGPDEEQPILPSYVDVRVNRMVSKLAKVNSTSQIPTLELKQETTVEKVTSDDKPMKKVTENNNKKSTIKGPSEPVQGNDLVIVSSTEVGDEVHEEPKKSKEEIELIRKAEERRKEEVEAKLKEQRRLEELAKANEARERKK